MHKTAIFPLNHFSYFWSEIKDWKKIKRITGIQSLRLVLSIALDGFSFAGNSRWQNLNLWFSFFWVPLFTAIGARVMRYNAACKAFILFPWHVFYVESALFTNESANFILSRFLLYLSMHLHWYTYRCRWVLCAFASHHSQRHRRRGAPQSQACGGGEQAASSPLRRRPAVLPPVWATRGYPFFVSFVVRKICGDGWWVDSRLDGVGLIRIVSRERSSGWLRVTFRWRVSCLYFLKKWVGAHFFSLCRHGLRGGYVIRPNEALTWDIE